MYNLVWKILTKEKLSKNFINFINTFPCQKLAPHSNICMGLSYQAFIIEGFTKNNYLLKFDGMRFFDAILNILYVIAALDRFNFGGIETMQL